MIPIKGFEKVYYATKEGKIWAAPRKGKGGHNGKFLKTWLIGHGYEMVMLYRKTQKPQKFLVHRLVAVAFIPNPENAPEVNHRDGNARNNIPENLEWCTSKQNKAHAWKKGLYTGKGVAHYAAKLDVKKVKYILKNYTGVRGQVPTFARQFDLNPASIRDVIARRTWKHVT